MRPPSYPPPRPATANGGDPRLTGVSADDVPDLIAAARALRDGRFAQAKSLLQAALARYPAHPELLRRLGFVRPGTQGRHGEAVDLLRRGSSSAMRAPTSAILTAPRRATTRPCGSRPAAATPGAATPTSRPGRCRAPTSQPCARSSRARACARTTGSRCPTRWARPRRTAAAIPTPSPRPPRTGAGSAASTSTAPRAGAASGRASPTRCPRTGSTPVCCARCRRGRP